MLALCWLLLKENEIPPFVRTVPFLCACVTPIPVRGLWEFLHILIVILIKFLFIYLFPTGSLLFLIFINDLRNDIKSEIKLFAGDVKRLIRPLSKEITQKELNKLSYWEDVCKLKFNIGKYISIIHLRCIREVFSDALSSLPISGYFCIISAPSVTPAWLWKSQAASMIATCYACASTKAKKN